MRYYEDLEYGVVVRFDARPGKMFGFLQVLNDDNKPTDEALWFHYNDGQWVRVSNDEVEWDGPSQYNNHAEQHLRAPQKGGILAFQRGYNQGGETASPWTPADKYQEACIMANVKHFRIILNDDEENVLWAGMCDLKYGIGRVTTFGSLPHELDERMTLQVLLADDEVDSPYFDDGGGSGVIAGGWTTCYDQEGDWMRIITLT